MRPALDPADQLVGVWRRMDRPHTQGRDPYKLHQLTYRRCRGVLLARHCRGLRH